MAIENIYNMPVILGSDVHCVTTDNRYFIARKDNLDIVESLDLNLSEQIWVAIWDERVVLKSWKAIYAIDLSKQSVASVWRTSRESMSLFNGGRAVEHHLDKESKTSRLSMVHCARGDTLWDIETDTITAKWPSDEIVLVGDIGRTYLELWDCSTGKPLWIFRPSFSTPYRIRLNTVQPGWTAMIVAVRSPRLTHKLYKVSAGTGKVLWEAEVPLDGYHYDTSRDWFVGFANNQVSIIDGKTGESMSHQANVVDSRSKGGTPGSAGYLDPQDGTLLFPFHFEGSYLGCFDYLGRKLKWLYKYCEAGGPQITKLWKHGDCVHVFDSSGVLRVGKIEVDGFNLL